MIIDDFVLTLIGRSGFGYFEGDHVAESVAQKVKVHRRRRLALHRRDKRHSCKVPKEFYVYLQYRETIPGPTLSFADSDLPSLLDILWESWKQYGIQTAEHLRNIILKQYYDCPWKPTNRYRKTR